MCYPTQAGAIITIEYRIGIPFERSRGSQGCRFNTAVPATSASSQAGVANNHFGNALAWMKDAMLANTDDGGEL